MGAGGAWALAAAAPDRFAAIAPVCHHGNDSQIDELLQLPVWAFHGARDEIVPVESHQKFLAEINRRGGNAHLGVFPEGTHGNIVMPVYRKPELYQWFLAQRRGAPPAPPPDDQHPNLSGR